MVNRVKGVTPSMAKKIFLEPRRIMGSICERISAISRKVFEIFNHICGPFIYVNHYSIYSYIIMVLMYSIIDFRKKVVLK